jgi:hypothetical protein
MFVKYVFVSHRYIAALSRGCFVEKMHWLVTSQDFLNQQKERRAY